MQHDAHPGHRRDAAADHAEVDRLTTRLGLWLDDKRLDEISTVFAEDASVQTAGGTAQGRDAIAAQAARTHGGGLTQHFITDRLIDVDGDHATVSANMLVVFDRPEGRRLVGERYRLDTVRTPHGWRVRHVQARVLWADPAPDAPAGTAS
ncbi:MAG TPA: nuclear transport factor 2 family protein [Thermomonospora sp.]|nr:nuclear transport factor 2 family protein [Thermomonospora sp.]